MIVATEGVGGLLLCGFAHLACPVSAFSGCCHAVEPGQVARFDAVCVAAGRYVEYVAVHGADEGVLRRCRRVGLGAEERDEEKQEDR
jgi:hypothetical protein